MSLDKLKLQTNQSFLKHVFQRTLMALIAVTASMVISTTSFAACGSLTMAEMNNFLISLGWLKPRDGGG